MKCMWRSNVFLIKMAIDILISDLSLQTSSSFQKPHRTLTPNFLRSDSNQNIGVQAMAGKLLNYYFFTILFCYIFMSGNKVGNLNS